MEGERKIQELAEKYRLCVQVTYLPFAPASSKTSGQEKEKETNRRRTVTGGRHPNPRSEKVIQILRSIPNLVSPSVGPPLSAEESTLSLTAVMKKRKPLVLSGASSVLLSKAIGHKRKPDPPEADPATTAQPPLPPPPPPAIEDSDGEGSKRRRLILSRTCETRDVTPEPKAPSQSKLFQSAVCFINRDRERKKIQP
jgi:hypothetical protein